jgi:GDPmannose 4,6-dehydratase
MRLGRPALVRALITGITGQDGPYLASHLDAAGWDVAGLVRGQMSWRWDEAQMLVPRMSLVRGDLLDMSSLQQALVSFRPDVVFNLAALSFVGTSWLEPEVTAQVTGLGCLRLLEAIRLTDPSIRFVQASSSEMFGGAHPLPQDETTPFAPQSPYAVAKVLAHQITVNYRESYGMHASAAVMFNHESPRRGREFVTRRITRAVARIAAGTRNEVTLGRLDPCRDWGWAPEYMAALPLIAALDEPDDFVLATGRSYSVGEWCQAAFAEAGLDYRDHVREDPGRYRPAEVQCLRGNAAKAKRLLGWEASVSFSEIVKRMVAADMEAL